MKKLNIIALSIMIIQTMYYANAFNRIDPFVNFEFLNEEEELDIKTTNYSDSQEQMSELTELLDEEEETVFLNNSRLNKYIKNNKLVNKCEENLQISEETNNIIKLIKTKNSNTVLFEYFISLGANLNVELENGDSVLLIACKNKARQAIPLLVKNGANVTKLNRNGISPIFEAIRSNDFDILMDLISDNIDIKDCLGRTPFFYAVVANNLIIAQNLKNLGADTNTKDNVGYTPLSFAQSKPQKFKNMLTFLTQNNLEQKQESVQQRTLEINELEEYLVSRRDNSSMKINIELLDACLKDSIHEVQRCLLLGADINFKFRNKSDDDLRFASGETPLHIASRRGEEEIVRYLLDNNARADEKTDDSKMTPLHYACIFGHLDIVKYLICLGDADISSLNKYNTTPLHFACTKARKIAIVEFLINCGANTDAKNTKNLTPLDWAKKNRNLEAQEALQSVYCY